MYVCICRVVTESRIRAAIDAGALSVDQVEAACGAGGECGACREEIQGILLDAQDRGCTICPRAGRDSSTSRAA
jgi:bacterioferritin-associated ferredoxin